MIRFLCLLLLVFFSAAEAAAEQPARLALLIGNQSYASAVGTLKNPHQDVALIGASLKKLGFTVTVLNDADYRAMDVALKRYAAELRRAGPGALGFFYYSGHGAANADTQTNYLIPVDVTSAEDETVWYQSFQQNQIIDLLSRQAATATQFVVFDACRNELHLSSSAAKAIGADKGFVPVATTAGLLIAYATAPNRSASDAGEGGGAYAKALAEELVKPGVEAVTMFRNVQIRVKQAIGQDPWLSFPSLAPVYLAGREATPSETARAWDEIKDLKDAAVFEAFRKQYALYDTLAAQKIAEFKRAQVAIVAPPKPVVSEDACDDGVLVSVAMGGEKPCIKPGSGVGFKDCLDCPEMVIAPSGSFTMGSPKDEPGRESWQAGTESPQHDVKIAKPLAVSRYQVTRGEWAHFVKATGHKTDGGCWAWTGSEWKENKSASWRSPGFAQDDSHPAVCISWEDAKAYAGWLSKQARKFYRLLSEAEYEYAARAGTTTPFWWGSSITPERANYDGAVEPYQGGGSKGEYREKTVPVKSFKPNPWGLYQVHGNVWSWVEDCWHDTYEGAPADGAAWTTGECKRRVLRGGSWVNYPRDLRAASRNWDLSVNRYVSVGFRLARTLNP